jgi:hypothetical protein
MAFSKKAIPKTFHENILAKKVYVLKFTDAPIVRVQVVYHHCSF